MTVPSSKVALCNRCFAERAVSKLDSSVTASVVRADNILPMLDVTVDNEVGSQGVAGENQEHFR